MSITGDFEELLKKEMSVLQRFFRFRIGNRHDADDVLQETCIAAFQSFDGLKDKSLVKPWLLGIARHKCNDYFRDQNPLNVMPKLLSYSIHLFSIKQQFYKITGL